MVEALLEGFTDETAGVAARESDESTSRLRLGGRLALGASYNVAAKSSNLASRSGAFASDWIKACKP